MDYILCLVSLSHLMCKSVDSSGDFPFLSTDLSFNMTHLPRYKLSLDSIYLKVNGTYFKTKYILTCPQNILLVDWTSQSYYPTSLFPKYILSYSSTVSYYDTLSTHMVMVGLHNGYSSFGALSQNVHSKNTCGDKLTTWG